MPDDTDHRPSPRSSEIGMELDLLEDTCVTAPAPAGDVGPCVLVAAASRELTQYICRGLALVDPAVRAYSEPRADKVLEQFADLKPVLIILDADLDDPGGFELCRAIRALPGGDGPRVLLLVDGARPHEVERRMITVGANRLLSKPFNLRQVAEEATQLLPPRDGP